MLYLTYMCKQKKIGGFENSVYPRKIQIQIKGRSINIMEGWIRGKDHEVKRSGAFLSRGRNSMKMTFVNICVRSGLLVSPEKEWNPGMCNKWVGLKDRMLSDVSQVQKA